MEILGGQKEHVTGLPLPFPSILPQRAVVANANEPNKPHKKMLSCFNSLKNIYPACYQTNCVIRVLIIRMVILTDALQKINSSESI